MCAYRGRRNTQRQKERKQITSEMTESLIYIELYRQGSSFFTKTRWFPSPHMTDVTIIGHHTLTANSSLFCPFQSNIHTTCGLLEDRTSCFVITQILSMLPL